MKCAVMRMSSPFIARRRGAEVLEVALLLPLVLTLLFGMAQFGWYFHVRHTIQAAAREAARVACVYGTSGTQSAATAKAQSIITGGGLTAGNVNIAFSATPESAAAGDNITVTVSTTWGQVGFPSVLPSSWLPVFDSSRQIQSQVVFRKEG